MLAAVLRFQSPEYLNLKSIDQPSLVLDELFALLQTVVVYSNLRTAPISLDEFKRPTRRTSGNQERMMSHVYSFSDCLDDRTGTETIWLAVAKENCMDLFDPV